MKNKLPYGVFPEKRKSGYVLVQFTSGKMSATTTRLWPPAMLGPRKPQVFATYKAAREFAVNWRTEQGKE